MKILERSPKKANKKANRSSEPRRHGVLSRHQWNQILSRPRPADLEELLTLYKEMCQSMLRREQKRLHLVVLSLFN